MYGVPHRSILEPLLFNAFFSDFFYFLEGADIATYADDNTPYNANLTQKPVILQVEETSSIFFKWFHNNYMKVNIIANIDNNRIDSEDMHELLGITIDSKLTSDIHFNRLC